MSTERRAFLAGLIGLASLSQVPVKFSAASRKTSYQWVGPILLQHVGKGFWVASLMMDGKEVTRTVAHESGKRSAISFDDYVLTDREERLPLVISTRNY